MATTTTRRTAAGIFDTREQAQRAVNELRRLNFTEQQIGVASRDGDEITGAGEVTDTGSKAATGAAAGAATGAGVGALWGLGVVAGVLPAIGPVIAGGTLAALAASAATGAATAGVAGALIGLGLPEDDAAEYEREFHAGRTIVTVEAGSRYDEAVAVLNREGARGTQARTTTASTNDPNCCT